MSRKSKRQIKAVDAIKPEAQPNQALDAFQNVLARLGEGSNNLSEGADYILTRLTRNYQLITAMYRSHWIIRKIVDGKPEDMCKNWIKLTCQAEPKHIDEFNKIVRKTKVKEHVLKGLKWGRLYGGAAGIMLIDGHEDMLDQPLNLDTVMPGSFKGILVLDRWSGVAPTSKTISDINDPDFDLPEMYQVTIAGAGGKLINVHASRVLRFTGRDLPYWERWAEMNWGISEVEIVFDEIKKRDNTSYNIASLIFRANIAVLKQGKLGSMLGVGTAQQQQNLYNILSAQNQLMSNQGMLVMDKDDSYEHHELQGLAGMSKIYECFVLDVCGAAGYPVTKLFGRSPEGMNSNGEGQQQDYDSEIEQNQESYLRPVLDKLLPVMAVSLWGVVPDDFDYEFNPVRSISTDKLADITAKLYEPIDKAFNSGIISRRTALMELKSTSELTGVFSTITDKEIAAADSEPQQAMDLPNFEPEQDETKD